jgi:medium-chain acyl-[acyl-carrier-protein] hydrolase
MWFQRRHHRPGARMRLFCFPHAGGGVATYRVWADRLPPDIDVCAVQMPGRDARAREAPCSDLPLLVESLAAGLAPHVDLPFAFFGHSLGALVAFEVTRQLRRQGGPLPVHLIVSARRAPQLPNVDTPTYDLPEPAFVDTLVRRYNGIPPAVLAEPELLAMFLPVLRADLEMTETYRYAPEDPLDVPITVLGGLEDRLAARADLAAWKDMTRAAFSLHMMAGGHFFVHTAPDEPLRIVTRQLAG